MRPACRADDAPYERYTLEDLMALFRGLNDLVAGVSMESKTASLLARLDEDLRDETSRQIRHSWYELRVLRLRYESPPEVVFEYFMPVVGMTVAAAPGFPIPRLMMSLVAG